ncbi:MAG TPA: hypothetical protein VM618_08070, partial [Acidimicrobiia bacterium]|nr:hypothetical protein [Acidimicrobiia bacterium]
MDLLGAAVLEGLRWGAVWGAFGLGLRHGFDWDHVAAITDITSSQDDTRRSLLFSTLYILGHGLILTVLGMAAVLAGSRIPAGLDEAMGRVIGATLVVLGVYVLVSLARHGRQARLRSRWMLAAAGVRRLVQWVRARRDRGDDGGDDGVIEIDHDHEHPVDDPHHDHGDVVAAIDGGDAPVAVATMHRHRHVHRGALPDDPFVTYGKGTSFAVGMLHGIGAETPTQMLLFVTAAGAGGAMAGATILMAFVVGLMLANTCIAVLFRGGVVGANRSSWFFAAVSIVVAALSLYLGTVYLFD